MVIVDLSRTLYLLNKLPLIQRLFCVFIIAISNSEEWTQMLIKLCRFEERSGKATYRYMCQISQRKFLSLRYSPFRIIRILKNLEKFLYFIKTV